MKKFKLLALFSLLAGFGWLTNSCSSDDLETPDPVNQAFNPDAALRASNVLDVLFCGIPTTVDFLAGKNIPAGSVTVGNDETNLYVTYTTTDGWLLNATHLYVGACNLIPLNKGNNPQIGKFPYHATHSPRVDSYTYTIPLDLLPGCMCVAAHAEVVRLDSLGNVIDSQTAWGDGTDMGGNSWATKFEYCKQTCDENPPTETQCFQKETAWAAGTRYNSGNGNWATFTSYSGVEKTDTIFAGQTIPVGTVTFSEASGGNITLSISFINDWILQEVSEPVKIQGYTSSPSGNPAPGLFTTYKGTSLSVLVPAFNFYGIHLDVRKRIPCN